MIWIRVYIDVFCMELLFYYYLNATLTLIFGYIKWTPEFVFTNIFLNIVFSQYVRQGMGKKLPPKTRNEFAVASFCSAISPMVSCPFSKKLEALV